MRRWCPSTAVPCLPPHGCLPHTAPPPPPCSPQVSDSRALEVLLPVFTSKKYIKALAGDAASIIGASLEEMFRWGGWCVVHGAWCMQ